MKLNRHLPGIFFSLTGFVYILIATTHFYLGVSPDSTVYIDVAENIIRKGSFTDFKGSLVTHFPPLYSFALAMLAKIMQVKVLTAATYFAAISFALSIFVSNLLFLKSEFSGRAIILLNIFLLLSPAFGVYLMLWSESLFILLLLTLTWVLLEWTGSRKPVLLAIAGIVAGLLLLTRYAGTGLVAGVVLFLLFEKGTAVSNKVKNLVAFAGICALGPAAWIIYTTSQSANPTNRQMVFHLISADHLDGLRQTIQSWLSPSLAIGALVVVVGLLYMIFRLWKAGIRMAKLYADNRLRLLIYLVAAYLGFLFSSISFFDFSTPLDNRMLSPVYPFCIMLTVPFGTLAKKIISPAYVPALILTGMLGLYCYNFYKTSKAFYQSGIGYTSAPWANSETIRMLADKKDLTVYTNGQEILQLLGPLQNTYRELPYKLNPVTKLANEKFAYEMQEMHKEVQSGKAILVFLAGVDYRAYYASRKELLEEYKGFELGEYHDGIILYAAD